MEEAPVWGRAFCGYQLQASPGQHVPQSCSCDGGSIVESFQRHQLCWRPQCPQIVHLSVEPRLPLSLGLSLAHSLLGPFRPLLSSLLSPIVSANSKGAPFPLAPPLPTPPHFWNSGASSTWPSTSWFLMSTGIGPAVEESRRRPINATASPQNCRGP